MGHEIIIVIETYYCYWSHNLSLEYPILLSQFVNGVSITVTGVSNIVIQAWVIIIICNWNMSYNCVIGT